MSEIIAILPALNEELSIGSVVLQTKRYADLMIIADNEGSGGPAELTGLR